MAVAAIMLMAVMTGCRPDEPKTISVTSITISPSGDVSVEVGKTTTLSATIAPSDATNKAVTWSSGNTNIATVDAQTGVITGVSAGTVTIHATAADGSGVVVTKSVTVVPNEIKVTGIAIAPAENVSVVVGRTITLTATVSPANATNNEITWSSLNPSIATIDTQTGEVTGVSAGKATIRVSAAGGSGVTASKDVTVNEPILPNYIAIDQNLGDQIGYAILGLDGSGYFYEFQNAYSYIPQRISIYDGNQNKVELIINFDENGLPKNILSEGFSIVLGKYQENRFNAVFVTKNGDIHMFENLVTDVFWDEYLNGISSFPTRAISNDPLQWINWAVGGIGCVLSVAAAPTGLGLALTAISCTNLIYNTDKIMGWNLLPDFQFGKDVGYYMGLGNCIASIVGDWTKAWSCVSSVTGTVVRYYDWIADNLKKEITFGENVLKTGYGELTITSPTYGTTYSCGDWIDIYIGGYDGVNWQDDLELQYWCLRNEPQPNNANESYSYTNKAFPRIEGTSSKPSFTFSPETPSVWDGNWAKLVAINKKDNSRSAPLYVRIVPRNIYEIVGVWKARFQNGNVGVGAVTLTINNNLNGLFEWIADTGQADRYNVSVNYSNGYNIVGTTWIENSISLWGFLNLYNGVISNGELKGTIRDSFLTNATFTFVKQ